MVAGVLVVVVPFVAPSFLMGGPVAWLLVGGSLVLAGVSWTVHGESDGDGRVRPVNCPDCGCQTTPARRTATTAGRRWTARPRDSVAI